MPPCGRFSPPIAPSIKSDELRLNFNLCAHRFQRIVRFKDPAATKRHLSPFFGRSNKHSNRTKRNSGLSFVEQRELKTKNFLSGRDGGPVKSIDEFARMLRFVTRKLLVCVICALYIIMLYAKSLYSEIEAELVPTSCSSDDASHAGKHRQIAVYVMYNNYN